jgi:hypothetical protein
MDEEDKIMIEEMNEVYDAWDYVSKEKAELMLRKIYLKKFNKLKNIENRRLILHNLTTVIMKINKDINSARHFSKLLIDMLDNYPNYKDLQINKERYCRALNNYTECFKGELNEKELIKIYEFCYETYKDYTYKNKEEYMEKIIAKFNLNLLNGNFILVIDSVKDVMIHNNNSQYEETLQSFMKDIEGKNNVLYRQALLLKQNKEIKAV